MTSFRRFWLAASGTTALAALAWSATARAQTIDSEDVTVQVAPRSPTEIVQQPTPIADQLADHVRALARDPRDIRALLGAGQAALQLGDANAAFDFFSRAERVSPSNGYAKAGQGSALLALERPRDALRLFDSAAALGVPVAQFAADRGLAHDLTGDPRRAQRDYQAALARGPDDETTRRYALSLGISGDRAQALALLDPLLYRRDVGAWRVRAFVLAMTGDVPGAQAIANQVMPGRPAAAMTPFFARLGSLSPMQRAYAVHLGQLPANGARYAQLEQGGAFAAPTTPPPIPLAQPRPEDVTQPVVRAPVSRAPRRRPGWTGGSRIARTMDPTPMPAPDPVQPGSPVAVTRERVVAEAGGVPQRVTPPIATTPAPTPAPARVAVPVSPAPAQTPAPQPAPASPSAGAAVPQASAPSLAVTAPSPRVVSTPPGGIPPAEAARRAAEAAAPAPPSVPASPPAPQPKPAVAQTPAPAVAKPVVGPPIPPGMAAAEPAVPTASASAPRATPTPAATPAPAPRPSPTPTPKPTATPKPSASSTPEAKAAAKKPPAKPVKKEPPKPKHPAREWVQIAGGANKATLPKEWARLKTAEPKLVAGLKAWTMPVRATNRLLVGPFASSGAAQEFVNRMTKAGHQAFAVSSQEGQVVEPLGAK
ncbi:tetratricopeptide (TPR) repeat protein [Sphingomonas zeicaulis]|uniref:tetratricopeptide repeat protein n=1 Tax=Sphingomonas zeicaulis TaxID=1632740 RepID=UPI003D22854A